MPLCSFVPSRITLLTMTNKSGVHRGELQIQKKNEASTTRTHHAHCIAGALTHPTCCTRKHAQVYRNEVAQHHGHTSPIIQIAAHHSRPMLATIGRTGEVCSLLFSFPDLFSLSAHTAWDR